MARLEPRLQHLVNILIMMGADGRVTDREETAFSLLAEELGLDSFDRKIALDAAEGGDSALALPERWSARIRNLEDLLYVGYCDGRLTTDEKALIKRFGAEVGITQQQFDHMRQTAKARARAIIDGAPCRFCQKIVPADSERCASCGTRV